jgi:SAM-dependent methyltransferase
MAFKQSFVKKINEIARKHPKYLLFVLGTFHRDTVRRLKKLIQFEDLILDVGSLNSPYTAYFPNTIVTIDLPEKGCFGFSKEVLKELRLRRNVSPIIASCEALPAKAGSFDKIICTEVLEHIYDDGAAVSEMARVLKTEGKIFLTTPNKDDIPLEWGIKEHVRHYTQNNLNDLLLKSFREVIIEKRFRLWSFLRVGVAFWTSWNKNRLNMHFLLASSFSSWIYDLIYFLERFQQGDNRGYNLVAICSKPLEDARQWLS